MTDKEKILRAIKQKQQEIWPTDTGEMKPATVPNNLEQGWLNALTWMERYINSIPVLQPSEDFKEEFDNYLVHGNIRNPNFDGPFGYDDIRKAAIHFANWQKEQIMKSAIGALVDEDTENVGKKTLLLIGEQRDALNTRLSNYEYGETVKLVIINEN